MTIRVKHLPNPRRSAIYQPTIEGFSAVDEALSPEMIPLIITTHRVRDIAYDRSPSMRCTFFPPEWKDLT
jgi:hypothetical protein